MGPILGPWRDGQGPILGLIARTGWGTYTRADLQQHRPSPTCSTDVLQRPPTPSGTLRRSPTSLQQQPSGSNTCYVGLIYLVYRRISSASMLFQHFELTSTTAHCPVHMPKHPKRGGGPILWMCHAELANPPAALRPASLSALRPASASVVSSLGSQLCGRARLRALASRIPLSQSWSRLTS